MSTYFSESADALLLEWLSQERWFRQSGEAEDGFWRFAVAMLQAQTGQRTA